MFKAGLVCRIGGIPEVGLVVFSIVTEGLCRRPEKTRQLPRFERIAKVVSTEMECIYRLSFICVSYHSLRPDFGHYKHTGAQQNPSHVNTMKKLRMPYGDRL